MSGAGEEDAGPPRADEAVQAEGEALEFGRWEDAAVEADDGDFDGRAEDEVGELVGEEDLIELRLLYIEMGVQTGIPSSSW